MAAKTNYGWLTKKDTDDGGKVSTKENGRP